MKNRLYIAIWANCLLSVTITAQEAYKTEVTVVLTSEGQYNTTNHKANWVNLLEVSTETNLGGNLTLIGDLISVQNTRDQKDKGSVCSDLQTFSNIEEDSHEISIFALGPSWAVTERFNLFLGVRNINMDYFSSPLTSLFTGSSQGIYPTISCNWNLAANYPLAGMCLHLEWTPFGNWEFKNSFYNGVSSNKFTEVFRFRPQRDGVFNMTQFGYAEPEDGKCWLGKYYAGFSYGNAPYEEGGKKDSRTSVYGLIEQPFIARDLGLLLEGGWASGSQTCHHYFGTGAIYSNLFKKGADFGVMVNRAIFEDGRETDVELTYSIPLTKHTTVQPGMHLVRTSGTSNRIGVIRLCISL